MAQLVLFNKPFNVLSQFTDKSMQDNPRDTLSPYIKIPNVYAAGRLDRDSEGLLILTDNGKLQAMIADPKNKMEKSYWAQVEGIPSLEKLAELQNGIRLNDGMIRPAKAHIIEEPRGLWPRNPPIRVRKSVPDTWINITISEGRNRQVRRMCAAIGHPCLRLIRHQIGPWSIDGIALGSYRIITAS